jgi:uncharacterized Ntn-hydrolase superfamily protein
MAERPCVATYSIAACDLEAGQWGVAVQSRFLAVGAVVPWAAAGVGAVATQAWANPTYGPRGLELLRDGVPAAEVVERLTADDTQRDERQAGVVDRNGGSANFTGSACNDWAGGRTGPCYAAQGNILVGPETVDALAMTFEKTADGRPLADRLLECLVAAQTAGGDRRGQQSASLLVVQRDAGYAGLSDVLVDLRVDDHERPIGELQRLYALHERLYGRTPDEDWLAVDEALAGELRQRLAQLGYVGELADALDRWAGNENLEMRLDARAAERIDPIVLETLREQTA